jgi:hypothetical protein
MITPITTIAAAPIGPPLLFLFVLLFGFGVYWVIVRRKYSEALLVVAVVGGAISLIWGMVLVGKNNPDGWLVGAIMLGSGFFPVKTLK